MIDLDLIWLAGAMVLLLVVIGVLVYQRVRANRQKQAQVVLLRLGQRRR